MIFDVIGPVKQPMYCVRFNSMEHIEKNKVEVGMLVYCAPKTPYTCKFLKKILHFLLFGRKMLNVFL